MISESKFPQQSGSSANTSYLRPKSAAGSMKSSKRPSKKYELEMWVRSFEFIAYFLIYTFVIGYIGYLFATLLFAVCLTYRLGYRSRRWIAVSASSAFAIVLLFRTILQIKTPVNIWLYNQLPVSIESFMKVYF